MYYVDRQMLTVNKLHETTCPVKSVVTIQVKGVFSTKNIPEEALNVSNPELYRKVWDAQDIVSPDGGGDSGGFFVMTNLHITPNQTRGFCAEVSNFKRL